MNLGKTLLVTGRKEWRQWLKKNYDKEKEIWLVYPNKHSKKKRIEYNDAVEEALCFGWIDSNVKKVDELSHAQRFTPRKPKSKYSQANIERLRKLSEEGKLLPEVNSTVEKIISQKFIFPKDILNTIKANPVAWKNYKEFSEPYKRICIAFIEGARKRPAEFEKRLSYFVKMTEQNKMFGFGGVNIYY
ncbi:MAG: YdeI/OmpD-associated family protein [Bacteroidetes bacterium]|nr:YdeI/OmpD-associated family protein [Bacteroidota bacterium]